MNNTTSSVKVVSTGSPQGCVLSPLLFILYTKKDCRSIRPNRYFIKFSDDIDLLSLFSNDEVGHGPVLSDFVWYDRSYLCLNATRTKDLCIDLRKCPPSQSVIHDNKVGVVDEYKYLGTTIDNRLKWDRSVIYKKCHQRLYSLRKLCSFNIDSTILSMIYQSCIQSVLTFSFMCWFGNVSQEDKNFLVAARWFRNIIYKTKVIGRVIHSCQCLYDFSTTSTSDVMCVCCIFFFYL